MKKRKLFMLVSGVCLVLILALLPLMAACAEEAPAPAPVPTPAPAPKPVEPIVLKAHGFLPEKNDVMYYLHEYVKRANERSKGELVMEYIGGPEVVSMLDQPEALMGGVFDFAATATSFYLSEAPEGSALFISEVSPTEERERGFNAFMDEIYRDRLGLHYMGRLNYCEFFLWPAKKRVEKPADVAGMKVRSMRHCDPLIKALDGVPVTIKTPEAYSALERGVCEAYAGDVFIISGMKLYEVVKYKIDHPIYLPSGAFAMNLDSWNRIPKHLQDMLTQIEVELDKDIPARTVELEKAANQVALDNGMEFLKFSPEDAKFYVDIARSSCWDVMEEAVSSENLAKLKELLIK